MYLVFTIPKELDERILLYYYSLDTYITLLHLLYWYIKVVVGVMGFISRELVFFFYNPIIQWTKIVPLFKIILYLDSGLKHCFGVLEKYKFCVAESTSPQLKCLGN